MKGFAEGSLLTLYKSMLCMITQSYESELLCALDPVNHTTIRALQYFPLSFITFEMALAHCRHSLLYRTSSLVRANLNGQSCRAYPAVPDDQPKMPSEKPVEDERQKNMESKVKY